MRRYDLQTKTLENASLDSSAVFKSLSAGKERNRSRRRVKGSSSRETEWKWPRLDLSRHREEHSKVKKRQKQRVKFKRNEFRENFPRELRYLLVEVVRRETSSRSVIQSGYFENPTSIENGKAKTKISSRKNIRVCMLIRIGWYMDTREGSPRPPNTNEIKGRKEEEVKKKVYKDVRPGPLDFRQRGTPEPRFPIVKAEDARASPFRGESIPSLPERKK